MGRPLTERARVGVAFLGEGRKALLALAENHYLAADGLASRLGLRDDVRAALRHPYERWDGKGAFGDKGDDILLSSRLMNLADVVEVVHRIGGLDAAISVARDRSGAQFDPAIVNLFCEVAPMIFADLDSASSWDEVIASEPTLGTTVSGEELDDALAAIADFADLKSPWTIGHSRAVAELAMLAGPTYGLSRDDMGLSPSGAPARHRPPRGLERGLGQGRSVTRC